MRNRLAPILWTGLMSESLREIQRTLVVQSDDLKYKVAQLREENGFVFHY
jgi:hypothetical protein